MPAINAPEWSTDDLLGLSATGAISNLGELEATVKVKGLFRIGQQWMWCIPTDTGYDSYETNRAGDGIFQVNDRTMERHQITGTCQFSLRGCSRSAAYHRVVRWFYEVE
jgi:hypothetical protein